MNRNEIQTIPKHNSGCNTGDNAVRNDKGMHRRFLPGLARGCGNFLSTRLVARMSLVYLMLLFVLTSISGCDSKTEAAPPPPLPKVLYMPVTGKTLTLTTELPGRVSAFIVSDVRPQVSGILRERFFEEGADVKAGQVLYQIDPSLFQASYNNAKANLAKAQATEKVAGLLASRYGKIVKTNAVSVQDYDNAVASHLQAKASVESAKQQLETARINLGYTKVTAPVSGRIGRSYVTPGALVTQNQASSLASIQHLDTVYVDLVQSNSEMMKLRRAVAKGDLHSGNDSAKVKLILEDGTPYVKRPDLAEQGLDPQWIEGDLMFSDVTIERSTGMVNIRAKFSNDKHILLPGMYVRALVEEGVRENAVLVPQKAVQRDTRGRPYVYVLQQKEQEGGEIYEVALRNIVIDRDIDNQWLLSSGLEPGEKLLVEGHLKARPGAEVQAALAPMATTLSAERATGSYRR